MMFEEKTENKNTDSTSKISKAYYDPNDVEKLKAALLDEALEACLDPEELATRLTSVFLKKTGRAFGHIHFYFQNKSDHIVFLWSEGEVDTILAKSAHCEKGQHIHWVDSQFSDYRREEVIKKLYHEIKRIEIDDVLNKTWPSYIEFTSWLVKNQK